MNGFTEVYYSSVFGLECSTGPDASLFVIVPSCRLFISTSRISFLGIFGLAARRKGREMKHSPNFRTVGFTVGTFLWRNRKR